jgi:hypothetical protein
LVERKPRPSDKYAHLFEEPKNPGKLYKEYRRIANEREQGKREAYMARLKSEREERVRLFGPISSKADRGFIDD